MYRLHAIILCLALAVAAGFAQAPLKAPRSEAGQGWRIAGFSADSLRQALGARPSMSSKVCGRTLPTVPWWQ